MKMKYATTMITIAIIVHLFGHFVPEALPEHIFDTNLDAHMRFHTFQSSFWILGIDLLILAITYNAFRYQQRWSCFALLFAGIPSQLAFYFALGVFSEGAPEIGLVVHILMFVTMLLYFGGVLLGMKICFTKTVPEPLD